MSPLEPATRGSSTKATFPETSPGPENKDVAVFPDLVFKEFVAALAVSVVLLVWALAMNAPLLAEADPVRTENPAKAPWYFVGLQELLVYFDPWIAGVMIPTLIMVALMAIPYLDTSRVSEGEYTIRTRRLAIAHFLFGFALWWILILIGEVFRGPNWQFYWPWQDWSITKTVDQSLWSLPWWLGVLGLAVYFTLGLALPRRRWPWLYEGLGGPRYYAVITLALFMYGVPFKIFIRMFLHVKYILVTPWFRI